MSWPRGLPSPLFDVRIPVAICTENINSSERLPLFFWSVYFFLVINYTVHLCTLFSFACAHDDFIDSARDNHFAKISRAFQKSKICEAEKSNKQKRPFELAGFFFQKCNKNPPRVQLLFER